MMDKNINWLPKDGQIGRWFSRGYLPHYDDALLLQHVTIHLSDSLPGAKIDYFKSLVHDLPDKERKRELRKKLEAWIDAGPGCCLLQHPDIAQCVQETLLYFNGSRYQVHEWVIMPNHVHVLFQQFEGFNLDKVVASWKKYTGRKIHDYLIETRQDDLRKVLSPVWSAEYWDRFIRNEKHYQNVIDYIHNNPVKAGIVRRAKDWPWSSASLGSANLCIRKKLE
jgi:REP-associated tyrosine transposase